MKVKEAAKRLNKSEQFIRAGLQHGRFPFGTAVRVVNRWNYDIRDEAFERYCNEGIEFKLKN